MTSLAGSLTGLHGLPRVDWEAAWEAYQHTRVAPADARSWDARAAGYASRDVDAGEYERRFLQLAAIKPGETVLDMGCGTGLLAIPLAQAGHRVIAADFSRGMLNVLKQRAIEAGSQVAEKITPCQLSWDDPADVWDAAGVGENSVDVVIASRSLATYHLEHALEMFDRAARRRVCLTVTTDRSPRADDRVFEAIGRQRPVALDHVFVLNMLFELGIYPELTYITTHGWPGFRDREDARRKLAKMAGGDLTSKEYARLETFLDEHYAVDPSIGQADADPNADLSHLYRSDKPRSVRWAFIAWSHNDEH